MHQAKTCVLLTACAYKIHCGYTARIIPIALVHGLTPETCGRRPSAKAASQNGGHTFSLFLFSGYNCGWSQASCPTINRVMAVRPHTHGPKTNCHIYSVTDFRIRSDECIHTYRSSDSYFLKCMFRLAPSPCLMGYKCDALRRVKNRSPLLWEAFFFTTDMFTHITFTSSDTRLYFSSATFFRELRRPPFLREHGSSW